MLYRRYGYPSAWQEFNRMQREVDRMFGGFVPGRMRSQPNFPAVNIWNGEDAQLLTAELPGVDAKDIDINVSGDTLTLSGERKLEPLAEGAEYHRQERGYGKFSRTIQLEFPVEVDKVDASLEKGVLKVYLPRAEADKPKKVAIKTA